MSIKILNIKEKSDSDTLLATLDIQFVDSDITINGAKIVNGKHGLFLAMPQYGEKFDGQWKFFDAVSLPKDIKTKLQETAIAQYKRFADSPF